MSSNKVRIDELASTGEALDTDTLLIETANGTKKITKADMFKEVKEAEPAKETKKVLPFFVNKFLNDK